MKKRVLITGISGQDGSYLAEHLLDLDYEVYGIIRRQSVSENQESRIHHLDGKITTFYGDMLDPISLTKILNDVKPNKIFNLAAQSHVRVSFEVPHFTIQTNGIGTLNILDLYRRVVPKAKFYQASSSEMFGNNFDHDEFQRETTPMMPVSPYGCAKLIGYHLVRHYRNAYNLHACNGILFNHESPRRGSNFVTSKVIKRAVEIYLGRENTLELGNLDSFRDWGHSKDYVRAMNMILDYDTPDDFVICTGETHSIRELCEITFNKLGLDYKKYVKQNPKYIRSEELAYLRGDCSKAKRELHWIPEYSFDDLIQEMVDHWLSVLSPKDNHV